MEKEKKPKKTQLKGKLDTVDITRMLNKMAGLQVSNIASKIDLEPDEWISSGCLLLDCLGNKNSRKGLIGAGKISEISGESGTAKTYVAIKLAVSAQKMGWDVIYYDSESALSPTFIARSGADPEKLVYCQAKSVEFVMDSMIELLENNENRMLFIWDSLALTPTEHSLIDIDPMSQIAMKPRLLGEGFSKMTQMIGNSRSHLLVINQLRTKIGAGKYDQDPFTIPGGKTIRYAYSSTLRLTRAEAKDSLHTDDRGNVDGTEITAVVTKSRFGTFKKKVKFQILWGEQVEYNEKPYWLDVISEHPSIKSGTWWTLTYPDGTEKKFQKATFADTLDADPKFYKRVIELIDIELTQKKNTDETE